MSYLECPYCESDIDTDDFDGETSSHKCDECGNCFDIKIDYEIVYEAVMNCKTNNREHTLVEKDHGHYITSSCNDCGYRGHKWKD